MGVDQTSRFRKNLILKIGYCLKHKEAKNIQNHKIPT